MSYISNLNEFTIFLESKGSSELQGVEEFRQILNDVEVFNWPHLAADFRFSDIGIPKLLATFRAYGEARFLAFTAESTNEDDAVLNEKRVKVSS